MSNMMRIEKGRSMLLPVLLITILTVTQTVYASANNDAQKALFGCSAAGDSFLYVGGVPGPDGMVPSGAWGSLACAGSALVEELTIPPGPGWYFADPGSVQCTGVVVARWQLDSVKYRLIVSFHATEQATGLFIPDGDHFTVPIPDSPSQPTQLSYEGMLFEDRDVQRVSGVAAIGASEAAGTQFIIFIIELDLDDGTPTFVTLQWLEDDARAFRHRVRVFDT